MAASKYLEIILNAKDNTASGISGAANNLNKVKGKGGAVEEIAKSAAILAKTRIILDGIGVGVNGVQTLWHLATGNIDKAGEASQKFKDGLESLPLGLGEIVKSFEKIGFQVDDLIRGSKSYNNELKAINAEIEKGAFRGEQNDRVITFTGQVNKDIKGLNDDSIQDSFSNNFNKQLNKIDIDAQNKKR
ncbi:MAG: hypothetical protein ABIP54_03710, partial [Candidatus Andersenbacteria bacterium]